MLIRGGSGFAGAHSIAETALGDNVRSARRAGRP